MSPVTNRRLTLKLRNVSRIWNVSKNVSRSCKLKKFIKDAKCSKSHRPEYMDEFEQLEVHLKDLYSQYVNRFRNVVFLQQMHDDFEKMEAERNLVRIKQSINRINQSIRRPRRHYGVPQSALVKKRKPSFNKSRSSTSISTRIRMQMEVID